MNAQHSVANKRDEGIAGLLARYDLKALKNYQKQTERPSYIGIPGDAGWPVLGHLYPFLTNLHGWLDKQYQAYGSVFKLCTPAISGVYLIGPEANKLVLQNESMLFSNFLAWEPTLSTLFDNNLLQRDFTDHKVQRKILQQAFKRAAIDGHMELMNPMMREGVSKLISGDTIKAMDMVKRLLLNMGSKVFLGLDAGAEANRLNKAFTDIVDGTADPFRRKEIWFSAYARGLRGNATITRYIAENIGQRRLIESRDMFSYLCHLRDDEGNLINDEQVKDHLIFLLFAAHDTTTSALSAILYALASNLQWQEQLREEISALNKETLEFDDLERLEKTGWTFSEALRMYPALHSIPRYALRDFEFHGQLIPANTMVLLSTILTHHMPEYWTNPNEFDPYRFSPERAEDKKDFYQYIPFGGGAHKCLGLHFAQIQAKMFLFYLLKQYRVTKSPKMTTYRYKSVPLAFPSDGLPLTFTRI